MDQQTSFVSISKRQRLAAWLVHAFTATGAYIGLLALLAIYQHKFLAALWLMSAAIIIDAVDGFFARFVNVRMATPNIDGALLDNIVDFFNYTLVPAFFLLVVPLVPSGWQFTCVMAIVFSSAYQFTQIDAKTEDHFFKGFPSYWNIAIFYLFFWQMQPWINLTILFTLAILSFVPIKYVYPSRLDYLTAHIGLRLGMLFSTIIWGVATIGLLLVYPETNHFLVAISLSYLILYIAISFYRTFVPLTIHSPIASRQNASETLEESYAENS